MDTAITLASVPAVLALVNLLKPLGIPGKWNALAAVIIAVGINLAVHYFTGNAAFEAIASGLLLGLSASGLYDATETTKIELRAQ